MVHCSEAVDSHNVLVLLQMAGLVVIHEEGWACLARCGVWRLLGGGGRIGLANSNQLEDLTIRKDSPEGCACLYLLTYLLTYSMVQSPS